MEEGDICLECGRGTMWWTRVAPCYCHQVPPCGACVEAPLVCDNPLCGHTITVDEMGGG